MSTSSSSHSFIKKRSGRVTYNETRHPLFHGIRQRRPSGKWVCEVRNGNSTIWLGSHPTAEMAARARDVAEIWLRGEEARLNFQDSWWRLRIPASSDVDDVKKAAAAAAEAFRPRVVAAANMELPENEVPTSASIKYTDLDVFSSQESELDDMAKGMMVTPPPWYTQDTEAEIELTSLWNFPSF